MTFEDVKVGDLFTYLGNEYRRVLKFGVGDYYYQAIPINIDDYDPINLSPWTEVENIYTFVANFNRKDYYCSQTKDRYHLTIKQENICLGGWEYDNEIEVYHQIAHMVEQAAKSTKEVYNALINENK